MPEPSWIDEYFKWALLASWIPAIGFPLLYGLTSSWYRSFIGRALLTKSSAMLVLISLSNLFYLLGPEYTGRDTMKFVGSTLLVIGIWFQFLALLKAKLDQYRDERNPLVADEDVRHDV